MALNYTEKEIQDWFNSIHKCRISGKVVEKELKNIVGCGGDIYLKLSSGKKMYSVSAGYVDGIGICLIDAPIGAGAVYGTDVPQLGEEIYGILNLEDSKIVYKGKEKFIQYSEVPFCEGVGYGDYFSALNFYQKIGIIGGFLLLGGIIALIIKKYFFKKMKHKK